MPAARLRALDVEPAFLRGVHDPADSVEEQRIIDKALAGALKNIGPAIAGIGALERDELKVSAVGKDDEHVVRDAVGVLSAANDGETEVGVIGKSRITIGDRDDNVIERKRHECSCRKFNPRELKRGSRFRADDFSCDDKLVEVPTEKPRQGNLNYETWASRRGFLFASSALETLGRIPLANAQSASTAHEKALHEVEFT
jgi:hypothetical protein